MQIKTKHLSPVLTIFAFLISIMTQFLSAGTPGDVVLNYNKTGTDLPQGTHIGTLKVKPQDSSNYKFNFIGGSGAKYNHLFQIQDHSLLTHNILKSTGKKSIRIQAVSSTDTVETILNVQVQEHFYPKMVNKDLNNQNSVSSTISVADKSIIQRLEVMLMINHANLDTMQAQLTHKTNNKSVTLVKSLSSSSNCGSDSMLVTLKTKATSTIDFACPAIYDTSYQPSSNFLTYENETMAGEWQLDIDIPSTQAGDTGTFQRWAIGFIKKSSNNTPIINLSNQVIDKNDSIGTKVGTLEVLSSTMDSNITYSLVSGQADTYNHLFTIKNDVLHVDSILTTGKKSIRIQATDGDKTFEQPGYILVKGDKNLDSVTYQSGEELLLDKKFTKFDTTEKDTTITTTMDSIKYVKYRDSIDSKSSKKDQSTFTTIDEQDNNLNISSFYPNPFTHKTSLTYSLDERSNVSLKIFNINGELVQQVKRNHQSSGSHTLQWNGQSEKGQSIEKGTYIYSLEIQNTRSKTERKSGKLVLMD